MRVLTAWVLFFACPGAAISQEVRINAGLNLANISVTRDGRVDDANRLSSFQAGIIADLPLGSIFYLQPGLLFTGKGSKVEWGTPGASGHFRQTFNPYYIELPASFILKTPGSGNRFFAGAGPYLAMGVGGKTKTDGTSLLGISYSYSRDIRFSDDDPTTLNEEEGTGFNTIRRFDYGLNGTAGVEGSSLVLAIGYGYGLAKLQSNTNSSDDNRNKHRLLSFTLGFKF